MPFFSCFFCAFREFRGYAFGKSKLRKARSTQTALSFFTDHIVASAYHIGSVTLRFTFDYIDDPLSARYLPTFKAQGEYINASKKYFKKYPGHGYGVFRTFTSRADRRSRPIRLQAMGKRPAFPSAAGGKRSPIPPATGLERPQFKTAAIRQRPQFAPAAVLERPQFAQTAILERPPIPPREILALSLS